MNDLIEINYDCPDLFRTLKNVVYPGSSDESVHLVNSYCKSRKLDPLLKLLHIVAMPIYENGKKIKEKEVIMPGIGLYRVNATRTGRYIGVSDTEFGPTIKEKLGTGNYAIEIEYPEWARVSVFKMVGEIKCEFSSGKVYWKEEYASTSGGKPNYMWAKRVRGQIAKCAEAQALRRAFPEENGLNTMEEMQGNSFSNEPRERKNCNAEIAAQVLANKPDLMTLDSLQNPPHLETDEVTMLNVVPVKDDDEELEKKVDIFKLEYVIRDRKIPKSIIDNWYKQGKVESIADLKHETIKDLIKKYSNWGE